MNRVWTALLLLATIVVAGAVGYVVTHSDKVPNAGATPGYTATPLGTPTSAPGTPVGSGSDGPSSSGSTRPPKNDLKIVFVGDNWSAGVGLDDKTQRFPELVGSGLGAKTVTVIAKDGAGYAKRGPDGKDYGDLIDNVTSAKPTLVVVTGGRNDASDDVNTLTAAARSLFADLHGALPNATLIAVAPFWGDSPHPSDLANVDKAVQDGVEAAGGVYLNIPDPLAHHGEWMADNANPNAKGNQAIATALISKLQAQLGS